MEISILVIEEDFDLSKLFDHLLRIDGYEITLAHDWQMAQAAMAMSQPDLIIFDWALTNSDGYLWIDDLRATPETAHIPVIALSANAVPRDIEKSLDAGFFNYLTKPIKVDLFMDALDMALKTAEAAARIKAGRAYQQEKT